jgi:hypothetical protein
VDEIRGQQREWEEEQAEDEIQDEAVALPSGDPRGPEGDQHPNDQKYDPANGPTKYR